MGAGCDAMVEASKTFFRWIFPKEIEIPDCLLSLYEALYPDIDWGNVKFYDGKPFFAKSSAIKGITLPNFYGVHAIKVYFLAGEYDPCTCDGLETPVHEAYHVQQYEEMLHAYGLGFLRAFMIAYLAGSWRGGSSGHSMEGAAHAYHQRFTACCTGSPCDCSTDPPTLNQTAIDDLIANCPDLVITDTGFSFWELMFENTPGARWLWDKANELVEWACTLERGAIEVDVTLEPGQTPGLSAQSWGTIGKWILMCSAYGFLSLLMRLVAIIWAVIWGLIWTIITIILAVLIPIVELILLIVDGILWIVTGIVCAAEWLWAKFKEILVAICDWASNLEQVCTEWRTEREQRCAETEDQGYNECSETKDEGYNECSEEEDQGYNECCDWAPCSWFCDAWVWVSNIVCVAWTWVSNIVCVAWTWVSHVVCVAWTWIVSRTCAAFTWVVTGLTCWAR